MHSWPQRITRIALRSTLVSSLLAVVLASTAAAQISGTKNIPGDYATLALAITDLNTQGVGAGGVTLNLLAGNPETAPAGGYVVGGAGSQVLTTSSAANPVTIQGNGNTITASSALTVGALNDALFKLIGADFVTITGFTLQENPANVINTPAASNNMTEWGVALLYVTTADGSQNNTIQGNTITLNRAYTNTFGVYSNVRHSSTAIATTADIVNNTTAPNINNKVYGNTISNVNMGITFIGSGTAANQDVGNDVGGASAATGNIISNWGGAGALSGYISNSGTSYCIFMNHQKSDNVSFNTLTSAPVAGTAVTFRGIVKDYTTAAPTGTFNSAITNNTITMTSGFTSGTFIGINSVGVTAVATATINIDNNTLLNCAVTGVASSSAIVGIANSSVASALSISNNIIRGTTSTATTGGFTGITNTGAVVNSINISNNQIGNAAGNAITFSAATSGAVTGISSSAGAATATRTITGNNFQGFVHSVAGSSAHTYVTYNNIGAGTSNINNNTFTNLNVNTTGSITFITRSGNLPATGVENVNNNSIVTGFNKGGAGNTVTFFGANASSVAGASMTNNLNNFSNVTVTGATTIAGWSNTEGASNVNGPTKTITNNTFSGITGGTNATTVMSVDFSGANTLVGSNSITNVSAGGAVTAMSIGTSNSTTSPVTVSQNLIDPITSSGASAVTAISTGAQQVSISKNKIYDLTGTNAASTVNGILVTAGVAVNVSNNLIGNLFATTASGADMVRGISITSTTATSAVNLSFNTIYVNATSSGANFGSSGVFHTASATSTTASLTMKDNVIVNLSTPNGTGVTVAFRRSAAALNNYNSNSNNNLFYAGAPSASRLIYFDGVNSDQVLSAYKTRVNPADGSSVTENPPFLSTTGSSPNFLHIDPSIATQIESGGIPVAGIVDDFDGNARNVSTPDIGADEGTFTLADFNGPSISYAPLGPTNSLANRPFTNVTVTDPSGVNGTLGTRPRVYYKKSGDANTFVGNTSADNGWKFVEANGSSSPFDFTIDYSLLTAPVAASDVIQYFVVAQDLAGTPNVSINSGIFATQPASVNLAAANFPITGTIRSYQIVGAPLNGDYTVGLTLFKQVTGTNLTLVKQVHVVTKEVLEPVAQQPQGSGDKSSTEVHLDSAISWQMVTRQVQEVTWLPMVDGQKFDGDLFVKRAEKADLPPQVNAGVYATITAAVNDLNLRGVSGPVRFLLLDGSYPSEAFPITVNVTAVDVPTAANPVAIKPNTGVTSSVTGASAASSIFKIFNTNYITIDGSNTLNGTTRDLTIENTSVTTPSVVWYGSSGTTPIVGGALKNCIVRNGANTSSAVVISDGTTAGNAGFFSNMEVRNNKIEKAFIGVFAQGGTVPQNGSNLTYADNELNTAGANAIRLAGLYMQGVNGATVSGNTIGNFNTTNDENDVAIWLASGTINATASQNSISNIAYTGANGFAPLALNVTPGIAGSNINVTRNTITNISTSGSTQVRGIASAAAGSGDIVIQRNNVSGVTNTNATTFGAYGIDVSAANNFTIKNNFISDLRFNMSGGAAFSTQFGVFGIRIGAGTGHIVDDNSVNMFGAMTGTTNTSLLSAALCVVSATSTGMDIRNNILSNTLTGGSTSIAHVSAFLPSGGTSAMNLTWNNNAYYSGTDAARQGIAQVGTTPGTGFFLAGNFNPGATTPATNLRSYTSTLSAGGTNDDASFASTAAAPYTSNTDLHILTNIATPVSNTGVTIAGITDDFDGDLRQSPPDIGADEFCIYQVAASAGSGGSIAPPGTSVGPCGGSLTYTITPDPCFVIADVVVDGVSQGPLASYTFNNLTGNHTIVASFAAATYTITASAGPGGSIAPSGPTVVACGANQTFTITPDPCFAIQDVIVDGVSQGPQGTYTFTNVQANHTISASFVAITYTITASAGPGGSIAPTGATVVNCGANQTFTITPDPCFAIQDVIVDGVSQGPQGTYTFTNVQANHTISASFVQITYTITASAGAGGSIAPSGATVVNCGANQTFTITPDPCFAIQDVIVDGVSQGPQGTYTFTSVQANHTISASFVATTYTITASAGTGGSIAPSGATVVACGANQTFTITPDPCFAIQDVIVDGVSQGPQGTYTFTNVQANHTISATFTAITYTITASAGPGGSIAPSGATVVACGANQTFTITPDPCFAIQDVIVDGVSQGPQGSYTFTNVQANHTISATFTAITYTITASAGPGGSIVPSGAVVVACGANQTFTITPNPGFAILDVVVDAVSQGPQTSYTFTNVQANHTISATFVENVPPTVQVILPNGGESLIIGSIYPLTWTANDNVGVTCVDLYVSRNGVGGPWETIATCVPNSSPYLWTVTGPPTTTAIFRVDAHDAAGNTGTDKSDDLWTIMEFPTATVVSMFQANPVDEGVRVEWRIHDTEFVNEAHVQRSETRNGPFASLNSPVTIENGASVVLDRDVTPGKEYFYRLEGTTRAGQVVEMATLNATAGIPIKEFAIEGVAPNPATGPARIGFAIPRRAPIRLSVFDAQGREVAVLANQSYEPGRYTMTWNGDGPGGRLPSGMYFIRFHTPDLTTTRRLVLQH